MQQLLLTANSSNSTAPSWQPGSSCSNTLDCSLAGPAAQLQQQQLLLPTPAVAVPAHKGPLASAPSTAYAAVLLLLAGHAALHLYYIITWSTSRHSRNVIEMSAVSSVSTRWQRFRAWEVLWFWVGTSYDILTHVVVSGLLLQAVWTAMQGSCALPAVSWF
jgi:hypothetical protein